MFALSRRRDSGIDCNLVVNYQESPLSGNIDDDLFLSVFASFQELMIDVGIVVHIQIACALSLLNRSLTFLDSLLFHDGLLASHFLGLLFLLKIEKSGIGIRRGAEGDAENRHHSQSFAEAMGLHFCVLANEADFAFSLLAECFELFVVSEKEAEQLDFCRFAVFACLPADQGYFFGLPIPWRVRRAKMPALPKNVSRSLLDQRHRKEWKTLPGHGKDLEDGCRTHCLSRGGRALLRLPPSRFRTPGTDLKFCGLEVTMTPSRETSNVILLSENIEAQKSTSDSVDGSRSAPSGGSSSTGPRKVAF